MKAAPGDATLPHAEGRTRESLIVPSGATRVRELARGLLKTGLRAAETVVMHVVWRDASSEQARAGASESMRMPNGVESRILDAAEVLEASMDPILDLEESFAPRAFGKGDRCVGVFVGGKLASYGWYASNPTEVAFGLHIGWSSPDTMYMYKGFTHPGHRGCGLYSLGLVAAARVLRESHGTQTLFALVRRDNASSLVAAARAGYVPDGAFVASRHFGARGLLTTTARRRGLWVTRS